MTTQTRAFKIDDRVRHRHDDENQIVGTVTQIGSGDWDGYITVHWDDDDVSREPDSNLVLTEDLTTVLGVLEALNAEVRRHNARLAELALALREVQDAE